MAILESIRKQTTILILIIGLALFAFVISGVFTSGDLGGGKVGSSIAEINGEEISIDGFREKVDIASRNSGPNASTMQTVNQVWDQEVRNTIMEQQLEHLGLNIEQDQIMNYIGTIPGYSQNPQFQNENGVFDPNKFRAFIADIKVNQPAQYQFWLQNEASIIQSAKQQAYFNLVKAGVGATLKEGELDYRLANDKINIRYVRVPYTSIPDSSINVSKSEIRSYIETHKDDFKQDAARDIQFVYFEEKPSPEDENAVKTALAEVMDDRVEYNEATDTNDTLAGFRNTNDMAAFLDRNSDIKLDTIYKEKNQLPTKFADTLMDLKVGEIFGPYRDGDYYKISKMMDRKSNGSVKASHILIGYEGAERANPDVTRTKEEAEAEAKRLLREARDKDTQFVELARDNSDGPSAPNGGDLGYFQEGRMVPEFSDFAFQNPVGTIGMVETDFGFHIIKVDDKRDIVQIANLAREIEPSEGTINKLFTDATQFEMESISSDEAFSDLAKDKEYTVRPVNKINPTDENLPGLSSQRSIVKWAFEEDTDVGDIKRFDLTRGYAVVQLTKKYEEGLMSVEDASATVLPKLRKERKADQIISENEGKSIEEIAKDNNLSTSTASALTVKSPTIPGAGSEPAVVGAAFAMKKDDTSELIEGNTGVFKFTVTGKVPAPTLDNYSTYANSVKNSREAQVSTEVYNALKQASEIEDNRAVFY
ncbi:SurA N-terminal domain-containing protein [Pricia sp. S334]|uniref:Periplasmic chaperone PpiD n=1 Tax=Pricia mediterranea TaxID=3076079 RepID=A0ABU3L676_9FLAO|nr:SurA N-terminal domain-containing protein [Pricia sp. S334]MDT7829251.1 SurA N-terminal domain-containing protein [Pricia sp. S334]